LACGIYLKGLLNFYDAEKECGKIGARLPEISSEEDNDNISKLRVYSASSKKLL